MGHIELARWADDLLIAPATADFLAKISAGLADDLLTTLCLASQAPLFVAPAMNQAMWAHPATRDNIERLRARGVQFIGPDSGDQACGDIGPGRMSEPQAILQALLPAPGRLTGKRIVVTAGPTREAIDPVRFIANRSSGKMGFAVAAAAAGLGAKVTLVSGPVAQVTPVGVERIDVESAQQMHQAVLQALPGTDIFVACAAVADYRPVEVAQHKIKKDADAMQLNPDILAEVAASASSPFCVGFAAETRDLAEYAERKRLAKGLDMVAANEVSASQGFDTDDNALTVFWEGGRSVLSRQPKTQLAARLMELIADRFDAQITTQTA